MAITKEADPTAAAAQQASSNNNNAKFKCNFCHQEHDELDEKSEEHRELRDSLSSLESTISELIDLNCEPGEKCTARHFAKLREDIYATRDTFKSQIDAAADQARLCFLF